MNFEPYSHFAIEAKEFLGCCVHKNGADAHTENIMRNKQQHPGIKSKHVMLKLKDQGKKILMRCGHFLDLT